MRAILLIVFFMLAGQLHAQQRETEDDPAENAARMRRALRDSAVYHVGLSARPFVETEFGDEASKALLKMSPGVGERFAEFYSSGKFGKLPKSKELLILIAKQKQGNTIATWIINNHHQFDSDNIDAFLAKPYTYVLSLDKLSLVSEKKRVERENRRVEREPDHPVAASSYLPKIKKVDQEKYISVGCIAGAIALYVWWRRRRAAHEMA